MGEGLMAHTLHEDRDLNSPKELFDELSGVKVDPEMVQRKRCASPTLFYRPAT